MLLWHLETFFVNIEMEGQYLPKHVEKELRDLRYRLAHYGTLLSNVLRIFLRVVNGWYRKQARELGIKDSLGGSVTFVQRFGSALNLNPHFHSLLLDGAFNTCGDKDCCG